MVGMRILALLAILGTSLAKAQVGNVGSILDFLGGGGVSGGLSSTFSADFDDKLQVLVRSVKPKAEEILSVPFPLSKFEPKGYKKQTVAGTVYFVKVNIGTPRFGQTQDDWILLRIYEDLSGCACLENLKENVRQFSSINHIDSIYSCNECSNNGDNHPAPGGLDITRQADFVVRNLVQRLQNEIGFRLRHETNRLEAVSFRKQTVAGTNYFVKIDTGDSNNFLHVFIHEDLSGNVCIKGLEQFKGRFDQIDRIDGDNTGSCRTQPPQPPIIPGGLDNTRSADSTIRNLVRQAQNDIESRLGYPTNRLEPVSYKEQTVAGTNYFVKIDTGSRNNFIHVFIHEDLGGNVCVMGLEQSKTRNSQINYIDSDNNGFCGSEPPRPRNEINVNGQEFEVLRDNQGVTWEHARDLCRFKGKILAEPERQNIVQLANELRSFGLTNYWLGGRGTNNDIQWDSNSLSVIQWSQFSRFNSPGIWRDASHPNDKSRSKCLYIKDDAENNNPIGMFNCADTNYLTPICGRAPFGRK